MIHGVAAGQDGLPPLSSLVLEYFLAIFVLCASCRGTIGYHSFSDVEEGLPAVVGYRISSTIFSWRWVSESRAPQGTFDTVVSDRGKVPFNSVGGGPTIELVSDINEVLYRCDVHIDDRREVENDCL